MASANLSDFNPENMDSWYFGPMSREETNEILSSQKDSGVFLVRDSSSIRGDFVLCVKEDNKVSHYIVNILTVHGEKRYRIGDKEFPTLSTLLDFYKTHYLDTTPLIRPAPREEFVAKFDFAGTDIEDLPFKKNDILIILQKSQEQWWTAKDSAGKTGMVPANYIEKYHLVKEPVNHKTTEYQTPQNQHQQPSGMRKLPAKAVVIRQRIPNAYDQNALRLEVNDTVTVLEAPMTGSWRGELNGKIGEFPFTHVKWMDEIEENSTEMSKLSLY